MKKTLLFLIILLIIPHVSANFVCGKILDTKVTSASWFPVEIFYSDSPSSKNSCQVSPDGNKFCCDPTEIEGESWNIGKEITSRIFDGESTYFTDPVSLTISGEGFDVFPETQLKKAITIHEPTQSVFINEENIFVNVSTEEPFNSIRILLVKNDIVLFDEILCDNCNNVESIIELQGSGIYELEIIAENLDSEFMEKNFQFNNLGFLDVNSEKICSGCSNDYLPNNRELSYKLIIETDGTLADDLEIILPKELEILNYDTTDYSVSHNLLSIPISGEKIEKEVKIRTPSTIFPKSVFFKSVVGKKEILNEEITIYRLLRTKLFSEDIKYIPPDSKYTANYFSINPQNPLVYKTNSDLITDLAIFPNSELFNVGALFIEEENDEALAQFKIGTNIPNNVINRILIRFKLDKQVQSISLTNLATKNEINLEILSRDDNFIYYEAYAQNQGTFIISQDKKEEKSWWSMLFDTDE